MKFSTHRMVKSEDLNGANTLFGGKALAWIDEEAAIFSFLILNSKNLVTKAMSQVDFRAPAHLGDIIELGCDVVRFGRTSITVRCAMRNKTTKQDIITIDEITFVHLDVDGKSAPHGITEMRNDDV